MPQVHISFNDRDAIRHVSAVIDRRVNLPEQGPAPVKA
jgi:hypothetical protein